MNRWIDVHICTLGFISLMTSHFKADSKAKQSKANRSERTGKFDLNQPTNQPANRPTICLYIITHGRNPPRSRHPAFFFPGIFLRGRIMTYTFLMAWHNMAWQDHHSYLYIYTHFNKIYRFLGKWTTDFFIIVRGRNPARSES